MAHHHVRCHSGNGRHMSNTSNFSLDSCASCSRCSRYRALIDVTLSLCETILYLIFGRFKVFVTILGFVALGLESTLPIPQLIR